MKHADLVSSGAARRGDEVVNKYRNERLGVPEQGQLDARETGSGGIADVGE
jgi:hypothetical protein